MSDSVQVTVVDLPRSRKKALVVAINRPDRHNCFNTDVVYKLSNAFRTIADSLTFYQQKGGCKDSVLSVLGKVVETDTSPRVASSIVENHHNFVAVIFDAIGPSFCAGADLSDPPNPMEQTSDLPEHLLINPVYQMSRITVPIIGALKGHVITGGFELALACDILVGDPTTQFRDTHVKFNLAPCWGLSQKLQRRIGPGRAKLVSLTGRTIDANRAYEWGLLDELVLENKIDINSSFSSSYHRAIDIADSIGLMNDTMVKRYKRVIEEGGCTDLLKGLQRERELGFAHYAQTFENARVNAKQYIVNSERLRTRTAKL